MSAYGEQRCTPTRSKRSAVASKCRTAGLHYNYVLRNARGQNRRGPRSFTSAVVEVPAVPRGDARRDDDLAAVRDDAVRGGSSLSEQVSSPSWSAVPGFPWSRSKPV